MPYVETNGIETYYEAHGPEGAHPVVFVHGATSDHQLWCRQVDALREEYRVVTYDLRDHGKTDASPSGYSVATLAADLDALVEALALDRPVVCGLSLGGMVAQRHAVDYPGEARGYVFADTYVSNVLTIKERLLVKWVTDASLAAFETVGHERTRAVVNRLTELVVSEDATPDEDRTDRLREDSVEMSDEAAVRVYGATSEWREADVDLSAIEVPVLVLYGEHEPAWLVEPHAGHMSLAVPDVRVREVPGAGHNSHVDAPEAFADRLRSFLVEVAN